MVIRRGEIWWADLPDPKGSGPGYRRPVLVVQSDEFNRSAIRTTIVLVVTSNTALAAAPGNVAISRRQSGLPKNSVINVSQCITLDKNLLSERVASAPPKVMIAVEAGLQLVLNLGFAG
ncbi:MAG: type II toxin-antitoxin system PemK/MazF family toxin [Candidatus Sumerlaeaceae bacterium]|nr:type II toxin-antitoxin system PemK/MazF family toxin [Candidatus Sumerlaeaceae bacterium]